METQTLEEDQSTIKGFQSFPNEIIQEILSRLPMKSILRFKSVSKPWLSRISDPSFTKLHFNRATVDHRTAFFISAFDASTSKQYFLSAAGDGGPITHLMTLDGAYSKATTKAQHLNGLVCFCCDPMHSDFGYFYAPVFVINPSTRKVFQLPEPDCLMNDDDGVLHVFYLFGFDEYTNDHKILMIRGDVKPNSVEVSIFSMSSHSWRKIDAEPPIGFTWDGLRYNTGYSVSVNSVVHMMLDDPLGILAFDLRTEKFSVISIPQCVMPHQPVPEDYTSSDEIEDEVNRSCIFEINGCVGVFCYHGVEESKKLHIWVLQEYEKRVWVKEIIMFPESWIDLYDPFPFSFDVDKDEFIFASSKVSGNVVSVPTYNTKSKRFSSLHFTLSDQFLLSETLEFNQIKCCVESIRPL